VNQLGSKTRFHRRDVPLSPAASIISIDLQFAGSERNVYEVPPFGISASARSLTNPATITNLSRDDTHGFQSYPNLQPRRRAYRDA
jgi:hypothetical protein